MNSWRMPAYWQAGQRTCHLEDGGRATCKDTACCPHINPRAIAGAPKEQLRRSVPCCKHLHAMARHYVNIVLFSICLMLTEATCDTTAGSRCDRHCSLGHEQILAPWLSKAEHVSCQDCMLAGRCLPGLSTSCQGCHRCVQVQSHLASAHLCRRTICSAAIK